jgi:peptidoglycan/LPS O-acetylase OafA/YrhL
VNRSTALLSIAVALAAFGIYRGLYVPGMLVGPTTPLLLIGFLLQAIFGVVAGVGVWRRAPWAPLAIVLLGASVAATSLVQGFVLEIVAYLSALLEAVVAILVCLVIAAYVGRRPGDPLSRAGRSDRG